MHQSLAYWSAPSSAGLVERVGNASIQDVFSVAITDVHRRAACQREPQVHDTQGIGGPEPKTFCEVIHAKRYRTCVTLTPNRVNAKYDQAAPKPNAGQTRVIAEWLEPGFSVHSGNVGLFSGCVERAWDGA